MPKNPRDQRNASVKAPATKSVKSPSAPVFNQTSHTRKQNIVGEQSTATITPRRIEKNDDFVWNLPGFDKYGYYAAAEYLRRQEKNQGFRRQVKSSHVSKNIKAGLATEKVEQDMLDYLALLFARAKYLDRPAKHVTATALKLSSPRLQIWIAKNDGAQGEDQRFTENLEAWFNGKDNPASENSPATNWHSNSALMVSDIKYFWRDRHNHYASNIRSLWRELCRGLKSEPEENNSKVVGPSKMVHKGHGEAKKADNLEQVENDNCGLMETYEQLSQIFKAEMIPSEYFKDDWKDIVSLCTDETVSQAQLKKADDRALRPDIERDSYATPRLIADGTKSQLDLVRTFCKLLKAIQLLGTVSKAIKSLENFRSNSKIVAGNRIYLVFVDPIASLDLNIQENAAMVERMELWVKASNNPGFKRSVRETASILNTNKDVHRYFHCELQILDKFLDDPNLYDYIGCSKLSCFTCWRILQGTPFRTRGTHANLWAACAFPFTMDRQGSESRYQLIFALKKVQDHIIERVLRCALDPEFSFSGALSYAETHPPEVELKDRRTTRFYLKTLLSGEEIPVISAHAIRIPVEDGIPVWEIVDFSVISGRKEGTTRQRVVPFVLTDSNTDTWPHSRQVYSEQSGDDQIALTICAKKTEDRLMRDNEWFCDLIRVFHKHTFDPEKPTTRWRGDLYIFRTITLPRPLNGHQVDSIEKEEMNEAVQKCRDILQKDWATDQDQKAVWDVLALYYQPPL